MAGKTASVGGLNFRVGADSSALPADLAKSEAMVKASQRRTAESSMAIQRKAREREEKTAPRMTAGKGAEAANKLATAGGVSALGPIAALGSLGPAALAAGAALSLLSSAVSLATSAFQDFEKDLSLNATKATAAGEAFEVMGDSFKSTLTRSAGDFFDILSLGAVGEIQAGQQRGRELDRANAEIFKKNQARQAAEAAKLKEQQAVFNKITNGVTGFFRSGASQLSAWAKPANPEFDTEPIAQAMIATTAQMATYGSESALEILDAKSLAEEQKQSRLLAEIAKKSTPQVFVLEF